MTEPTFEAPGPGAWELEQTHMSRPLTRFAFEAFKHGFVKGFREGSERFGLTLSHFEPAHVNGFMYMKPIAVGAPPNAKGPPPKLILQIVSRVHPEMRRRGRACQEAFRRKLWFDDLRLWDEQFKPDSIRRNTELQSIDLAPLDEAGLVKHLETCRENLHEMAYRHHKWTFQSILPVGLFLGVGTETTGMSVPELLVLLKGSSPVSKGTARKELEDLCGVLRAENVTRASVPGNGHAALKALGDRSPAVKAALEKYLDVVGYMLTSGYDVAETVGYEMPDMLLGAIWSTLESGTRPDNDEATKAREAAARSRVPEARRAEFDEALADARKISRLRDERGVYNDIWGAGVARRAILEMGRRLVAKGALSKPEHLVEASESEMVDLFRGKGGPSDGELVQRRAWRTSKNITDAPPWLGAPPSPPPPYEWFPPSLRPGARAVQLAIMNVFDPPETATKAGVLQGIPVAPGTYEGPARVVNGSEEFDRIQKGDVLVARNTSAAFNVVLPLLGAIVTDRGGALSHAAIVAREYGIPGVVSTRTATAKIPDGARVRVNGDAGTVEVIARQ
jgi:pyruvate,water dikinase